MADTRTRRSEPATAPAPPATVFPTRRKRIGAPSKAAQTLVTQFVKDQPSTVTAEQVAALARLLRRSKGSVKQLVENARGELVAAASTYVNTHLLATVGALDKGDYEVAGKLSQWALENLGAEGVRIVEKKPTGDANAPSGPSIMIGIQLGGIGKLHETVAIAPSVVDAEVVK